MFKHTKLKILLRGVCVYFVCVRARACWGEGTHVDTHACLSNRVNVDAIVTITRTPSEMFTK